jgi:putative glutamine amidotransferase
MNHDKPRIAIPLPHSSDREYSERAIPQYERAVELAGGQPVRIPLDRSAAEVMDLVANCDGVLLPGSKADVDPAQFKAERSPHTAPADPQRDAVDYLLLEDAYASRKPVLGICYGLQSLNVYREGSLVQHILDFLPKEMQGRANHDAGRNVKVAHTVKVDASSKLAQIVNNGRTDPSAAEAALHEQPAIAALEALRHPKPSPEYELLEPGLPNPNNSLIVPVNSSHHQSADAIGDGLRVVARCTEDGIIEALEGTSPDHFVLAVQWHPERSVDDDEVSRAIFRALTEAAKH